MNGDEVLNEIDKLMKEEQIETDAAVRLLLAGQRTLIQGMTDFTAVQEALEKTVEEEVKSLREAIKVLTDYNVYYPSLSWLWVYKKRYVIAMALILMLVYAILFGWVGIQEARQAVLGFVGIEVP